MKKMLALSLSVMALIAMSGCEKETKESTANYILPAELADCKIFSMSSGVNWIKVVRCPLSVTTTTFPQGKTQSTVSVVDPNSAAPQYIPKVESTAPSVSQISKEPAKEIMVDGVLYRLVERN